MISPEPQGLLLQCWDEKDLDFGQVAVSIGHPEDKPHEISERGGLLAFKRMVATGLVVQHRSGLAGAHKGMPGDWIIEADRRFRLIRQKSGGRFLIHEGSGGIKSQDGRQAGDEAAVIQFVKQSLSRSPQKKPSRGLFVVLVGLDGAGKTTFARGIAGKIQEHSELGGFRYFHWIPKILAMEFPLPALVETPRKEASKGAVAVGLSIARLVKNLAVAWIAHLLRVCPLRRRGYLVIADRYVYNYWIDPVSLRYCGPKWALALAGRLFPRPDLVISLEAAPEILLARKQELTRAEMDEMKDKIRTVPVDPKKFHVLDAAKPPEEIVQDFFELVKSGVVRNPGRAIDQ
jgi:thymidylate kinase